MPNDLSIRCPRRFSSGSRRFLPDIQRSDLEGLIFISEKRDCFVAGADLEELSGIDDRRVVLDLVRRGHRICDRISALPFPVIAAIHGSCLGGGLELALACDRRVATDHQKTRLGLPEVQLGLIPGMGGTQRLPRLIGAASGLDMILTGRQLDARKALKSGLVEEVCHPEALDQAALGLIETGAIDGEAPALPKQGIGRRLGRKAGDWMATAKIGKRVFFERAREQVLRKTGGHYPAPLRAIDVVHEGLRLPLGEALEIEAQAFAELAVSDISQNLIGLFFMKREVEGRWDRKVPAIETLPSRIGVVGSGFHGGWHRTGFSPQRTSRSF